jgi:hypothetical protein
MTTKINLRHIAELLWGTGGTTAYRTNRKGVGYYSCSGHGGYVFLPDALTPDERAALDKVGYTPNETINVLKDVDSGTLYAVDYSPVNRQGTARSRTIRVPVTVNVEWVEQPLYTFEEDCAWAVLEYFTDVQYLKHGEAVNDYHAEAFNTVKRWYPEMLEIA